jgi:prepilin-type N-terminal cleavage/methylation domain-containing protein
MTLIELLIAMAVIGMVMATLGTLGLGVRQNHEYSQNYGLATQHARVALDRIARTVAEATTSAQFPGFLVVAETEGTVRFPDTLVVWHPSGAAADPDGLPRFNELVIYCPSPYLPNQLVELSVPSDTRVAPAASDAAQWLTEVRAIKQSNATKSVTLTTLLRTAAVSSSTLKWRGAVRFEQRLRPSETEWASYKAGTTAWQNLNWVQGIYGAQTGLRQAWLRTEIQLLPGAAWVANDPNGQQAVTFFGSSAVYYEMPR